MGGCKVWQEGEDGLPLMLWAFFPPLLSWTLPGSRPSQNHLQLLGCYSLSGQGKDAGPYAVLKRASFSGPAPGLPLELSVAGTSNHLFLIEA